MHNNEQGNVVQPSEAFMCICNVFLTRNNYVLLFIDSYIKYSVSYYRPQTKLRKGKFLHLSVSHSVQGGRCTHPPRQTPLGFPLLPQTAIVTYGTHPTGMHSC